MTDVFNVTGAYDKPSYNGGDVIKVTISGTDTNTVVTTGQVGPLTVPFVATNGAKSTLSVPKTTATFTTVATLPVTIDTTLPIVDTSPTPRTWAVSADKLSITAVA
jgi:hypothetical protein